MWIFHNRNFTLRAMRDKRNLVTVKLTDLVGKKVFARLAQVTNPKYLPGGEDFAPESGIEERWRILKSVTVTTEKGKKWVTLQWDKKPEDSCGFTGSTIEAGSCKIQFTPSEYAKI